MLAIIKQCCFSWHIRTLPDLCWLRSQEDRRGLVQLNIVPQKITTRESSQNSRYFVAHGLGDMLSRVTGNAANIEILFDEPSTGLGTPSCSCPFDVLVIAEAKTEIKYNKAYLKVCGGMECRFRYQSFGQS